MERISEISIRGRIAYLISLFVRMLESLNHNVDDWEIIINVLCEYTSNELLDDWLYKMAEYMPDSVLEDSIDGAEYITEEEQMVCKELYRNAEPCVHEMVNLIFEAGTYDTYSRIIGRGEYTIHKVQEAISLMNEHGFPITSIKPYLQFEFVDGDGWGEPFDSTILVRGKSGDN